MCALLAPAAFCCARCHGGRSNRHKFSIHRFEGAAQRGCYEVSVTFDGGLCKHQICIFTTHKHKHCSKSIAMRSFGDVFGRCTMPSSTERCPEHWSVHLGIEQGSQSLPCRLRSSIHLLFMQATSRPKQCKHTNHRGKNLHTRWCVCWRRLCKTRLNGLVRTCSAKGTHTSLNVLSSRAAVHQATPGHQHPRPDPAGHQEAMLHHR